MTVQSPSVLIAAGGTGGHVIPALEVARELRERGANVVWIGTRRGLEAQLVPAAGISVEWLSVEGIRGKSALSLLLVPVNLARALWQTLFIFSRQKPHAVLGMGGFVSGPSGLVAWLLRCPLVLHEQNAVPGFTNKLLKPLATRALQAMPSALGANSETVGNPVRCEIAQQDIPTERFKNRDGALRVLVIGGSQGARALNEIVPQAVALSTIEIEVHHQCGTSNRMATESAYAGITGATVRVKEFIDDMAHEYAWADLVVCRAGAMTVAEIAAVGVAAIFFPFTNAVDDHQTANAQKLVDTDAAILRQENELTPEWLKDTIDSFANDRIELIRMAGNARAQAKVDAAEIVANHILEVAR
ncbi:MAG: undecaprenyldiphospho-muramoylpentapeptide beta-N-acetylglucosaminyltransferase [Pseudomonadota bacterium]